MTYDKGLVMRIAHVAFKGLQKCMSREEFTANANMIWSLCLKTAHAQYKESCRTQNTIEKLHGRYFAA